MQDFAAVFHQQRKPHCVEGLAKSKHTSAILSFFGECPYSNAAVASLVLSAAPRYDAEATTLGMGDALATRHESRAAAPRRGGLRGEDGEQHDEKEQDEGAKGKTSHECGNRTMRTLHQQRWTKNECCCYALQ